MPTTALLRLLGTSTRTGATSAETLTSARKSTLRSAEAHDFYEILVSSKFKPPTALTEGGIWHELGLPARRSIVPPLCDVTRRSTHPTYSSR